MPICPQKSCIYHGNSQCFLILTYLLHQRVYFPSETKIYCLNIETFCICKNKGTDQLRSNCEADKLINTFVFATRRVQFLFFLNPKFQASSPLVWLHRPVCVRSGRKHRRSVFSRRRTICNNVNKKSFNMFSHV